MPNGQNPDRQWQRKLLPLMVTVLLGLTGIFVVTSYLEFQDFKRRLEAPNQSNEWKIILAPSRSLQEDQSTAFQYTKWRALVLLERESLHQRYNHSNTIILARMWTRYLGFLTGMILAIVGAVFILGKLKETESQLGAEANSIKFSITSSSPGLILSTLGTILILTTLIIKTDATVSDGNIYLMPENLPELPKPSDPGNGLGGEAIPK
jgi:Trk-type K+ transport system membrane component